MRVNAPGGWPAPPPGNPGAPQRSDAPLGAREETPVVDIKQQLMNQAFKLMQDPRVSKALQNPKVMQGLVTAVQLGTRVQQNLDENLRKVVHGLNLATVAEVEELRRTVSRLEDQLERERTTRALE